MLCQAQFLSECYVLASKNDYLLCTAVFPLSPTLSSLLSSSPLPCFFSLVFTFSKASLSCFSLPLSFPSPLSASRVCFSLGLSTPLFFFSHLSRVSSEIRHLRHASSGLVISSRQIKRTFETSVISAFAISSLSLFFVALSSLFLAPSLYSLSFFSPCFLFSCTFSFHTSLHSPSSTLRIAVPALLRPRPEMTVRHIISSHFRIPVHRTNQHGKHSGLTQARHFRTHSG